MTRYSCGGILAGLRFEEDLIRQLFREDIMRESVIYQSIRQEGKQEGLKQEALTLTLFCQSGWRIMS
ncbi:MAG: hypothetical protein F6K28_00440 [Microcoleus sp. SIO2G3]|nr:hypothetical protein [Microcoleus sp. SIO2G3]